MNGLEDSLMLTPSGQGKATQKSSSEWLWLA
jgi:hypothetical protein